MSETQTPSLLRRLNMELAILAVIVVVTMLLMSIRVHDRYIERRRATLMYTTDVDRGRAMALVDAMDAGGLLDGLDHGFSLSRPEDVWEFHAYASEETLQTPYNQQVLREVLIPICRSVFGNDSVNVRLTDEELVPRLLLFQLPTPPSAAEETP